MYLEFTKTIEGTPRPKRAYDNDAGLDLVAMKGRKVMEGLYEFDTGIAVAIPVGHVGLLFPRSSISGTGATLANSVGVIDSGYRGSIKVCFYADHAPYANGDKIAQLVIVPIVVPALREVDGLSLTSRSTGAFGSSGK
jgi:dUTP pyrophosphatase